MKSIATICNIILYSCTIGVSLGGTGFGKLPTGVIERFIPLGGPLILESNGKQDKYIETLGEQAGLWGTSGTQLEAWAYPFKLLGGMTFEYSVDGGKTYLAANEFLSKQIATPHVAQLKYSHKSFEVAETLFAPRQLPGAAILLDIESSVDLKVAMNFKVSLAPMLMHTKEKPQIQWNREDHLFEAHEMERGVEMLIWSPLSVLHRTQPDGSERIVLDIPATASRKGLVPIIIAASWKGQRPAKETLSKLALQTESLMNESKGHYKKILGNAPSVKSPDKQVNDALTWSVVSLDQLRVKNPFLGYGLISGIAPSGDSTKPGFAWFFDEPTLTSWAYLRAGLSSHITEAFEFLLRYQRDDGKMIHEITQSLPWYPDYFNKYRYAYIHASSGTYFLAACGNYYRQTGDMEFIRRNWTGLCKMLEWCKSALDEEDGLLRIGEKEWGSSESSFAVGKDTQMEGMWLCAIREMAYLAKAVKDDKLAKECSEMAEKASRSIEDKFWDDEMSSYLWGLDRADRPLRSLVPHHSVSVWMKTLRADRTEKMLERMARSDFRTDWGVRSLSAGEERYNPQGYQTGTVWPVWNAGVIIGDYRHNRQIDAFRNFLAMTRVRTLESLGPMPEVLNGENCKFFAHTVPHQMFAETAVQNAFYEGLLGLEIDVPAGYIELSPRLPSSWKDLAVTNMPIGSSRLDLQIENRDGRYRLTFEIRGEKAYSVHLRPLLPAGCRFESVQYDKENAKANTIVIASGTIVDFSTSQCLGKHTLAIEYKGGYDFVCEDPPLRLGDPSCNLRLIKIVFRENTWNLLVEGLPEKVYPLTFRTNKKPTSIIGGKLLESMDGKTRIGLISPDESEEAYGDFVRWQAKVEWK